MTSFSSSKSISLLKSNISLWLQSWPSWCHVQCFEEILCTLNASWSLSLTGPLGFHCSVLALKVTELTCPPFKRGALHCSPCVPMGRKGHFSHHILLHHPIFCLSSLPLFLGDSPQCVAGLTFAHRTQILDHHHCCCQCPEPPGVRGIIVQSCTLSYPSPRVTFWQITLVIPERIEISSITEFWGEHFLFLTMYFVANA